MKKLKLYGKKDNFEGFIAKIYVKNNKVVVESKDEAVKEILEKEISEAIKEKGGLWVPFVETVTEILIDTVKIEFYEENRKLNIKIIEDKDKKAKDLLEKINELQERYWNKLKKTIKEKPALYGLFRSKLVDGIIEQFKASGYKVEYIKGIHSDCYKFIKINDPNFIKIIRGVCFAQWRDNSGNYHPALFTKLRDIGYKVVFEKSLVVESNKFNKTTNEKAAQ